MNYCTRSRQVSSNSLMLLIYPHIATLVIIIFLLSFSLLDRVLLSVLAQIRTLGDLMEILGCSPHFLIMMCAL
jgi:hypothetical protein